MSDQDGTGKLTTEGGAQVDGLADGKVAVVYTRASAVGINLHAPTGEATLREAARDVLTAMDGLREKMGIRPMADFKPDYPFDRLLFARMHVLKDEEVKAVDIALACRLKGLEIELPEGWKASAAEETSDGPRP